MPPDEPLPLSREEARQLAEQLAVLAKAGLPLASGLRAAAEEIPSPRLAAAMSAVAERLEAGRSLDDVLRGSPQLMPEHMLRLVETGVRSGNLAEVLTHLVEIDRSSFDLRRTVRMAIAYPLLLMALCTVLIVFVAMYVVPDLSQVMDDFDTALPWATQALFWFSGKKVLALFGFGIASITMIIVLTRVSLPPQQWRWMQTRIPLVGPMLLWRGIANWARLASLLLKQGLPAPEALRLAATGVNDALMAVEGLRLARATSNGRSIADALGMIGKLPASTVPLVRWGEQHNRLPEAFDTVAEMFENRLRLRAALLQSILPPLAFICVALLALWLVNAMVLPLVSLIQSLASWGRRGAATAGSGPDPAFVAGVALATIVGAIGIGIWIRALRAIIVDPSRKPDSPLRAATAAVVKAVAWVIFFLVLLVAMTSLATLLGFFLWIATLIIALTIKIRHSDAERRALMWLLGTAVEKGIPLSAAARAFGEERRDRLGRRTRRLAQQLDGGISLDESLDNAHIRLPNDALVAVRAGYVTNSMTPLVNATSRRSVSVDGVVHSLAAKLLYMSMFLFSAVLIISFVQIKIVPAFVKIFQDFDQTLPPSTMLLIRSSNQVSQFAFLVFWLMLFLFMVLLFALVRYTGLVRWDPPLLRSMTLPFDESLVLRSLAEAVERNAPIYVMVAALARKYPKDYIRSRLQTASNHMSNGVDWCESLHASGLLPKAEAGVLKAAERVGNLGWAMNDMADRLSRRFVTRASGIMAVAFPLVLLLFAAVVFLVAYGLIEPLAELIVSLT